MNKKTFEISIHPKQKFKLATGYKISSFWNGHEHGVIVMASTKKSVEKAAIEEGIKAVKDLLAVLETFGEEVIDKDGMVDIKKVPNTPLKEVETKIIYE